MMFNVHDNDAKVLEHHQTNTHTHILANQRERTSQSDVETNIFQNNIICNKRWQKNEYSFGDIMQHMIPHACT